MKKMSLLLVGIAALAAIQPAEARDRYTTRPPVVVSPDLSAPWVMQLKSKQRPVARRAAGERLTGPARAPIGRVVRQRPSLFHTAGVPAPVKRQVRPQIDPMYLPQEVAYDGGKKPGTIIIDTQQNFLYLVQKNGKARRYGVGTGKPGFEWAGTHKVSRKQVWPDWRPPSEMIVRERAKGRILPAYMPGGPENPMGARALYLGSTLYRIHGTNQPWTIGGAVSSGCIRMRNEDVVDLYERVPVGATVHVI
jgi:lipoprotein-anchoring transpeptidase ErfK/SrfK